MSNPISDFLDRVDYLDQVDIAMLAPSRAGKSTLVCAMIDEFKRRLRQRGIEASLEPLGGEDDIYDYSNKILGKTVHAPVSTKVHIDNISRDYTKALKTPARKFTAAAKGTRDCAMLSFRLGDGNTAMPFRILDYPGGAISSNPFVVPGTDSSGLEDHARVLDVFSSNCFALVVPLFAMALMELFALDGKLAKGEISQEEFDIRHDRLEAVLCRSDIVSRVSTWVLDRAKQKKNGVLILAPVKCETFLNDTDEAVRFQKAGLLERVVKQFVFEQIIDEIRNADPGPDILKNIADYVTVEYLPVQTFGNVFSKALFEWPADLADHADAPSVTFSDIYYKKTGSIPHPSGAAGILQTILRARNGLLEEAKRKKGEALEAELDAQNWFFGFFRELFGLNDLLKFKIKVSFEEAAQMNALVAKIAGLGLGTKDLSRWDWDFSENGVEETDWSED